MKYLVALETWNADDYERPRRMFDDIIEARSWVRNRKDSYTASLYVVTKNGSLRLLDTFNSDEGWVKADEVLRQLYEAFHKDDPKPPPLPLPESLFGPMIDEMARIRRESFYQFAESLGQKMLNDLHPVEEWPDLVE